MRPRVGQSDRFIGRHRRRRRHQTVVVVVVAHGSDDKLHEILFWFSCCFVFFPRQISTNITTHAQAPRTQHRATYVNFVFKVYQVPASADGNLCLDFKMFLSQFPCEHQRHRQQTHYFNRCKETASDISSFKPQGFLLCSPQVLNLVRRAGRERGGSRRESTGGNTHTHTKLRAIFFFLLILEAHG